MRCLGNGIGVRSVSCAGGCHRQVLRGRPPVQCTCQPARGERCEPPRRWNQRAASATRWGTTESQVGRSESGAVPGKGSGESGEPEEGSGVERRTLPSLNRGERPTVTHLASLPMWVVSADPSARPPARRAAAAAAVPAYPGVEHRRKSWQPTRCSRTRDQGYTSCAPWLQVLRALSGPACALFP